MRRLDGRHFIERIESIQYLELKGTVILQLRHAETWDLENYAARVHQRRRSARQRVPATVLNLRPSGRPIQAENSE